MAEEEEAWEEALDLDDSDLSLLRPPKHHHQPPKPPAESATVGGSISRSEPFLRRCSSSASTSLSQSSQTSEHRRFEPNSSQLLCGSISRSEPLLRGCTSSYSTPVAQSSQASEHRRLEASSSPQLCLIPGPAGVLQAAMHRRKDQHNDILVCEGQEPVSTQEYVRRAMEDCGADDDDFERGPWLSAVDFIRRKRLVDDNGAIGMPLSVVKSLRTAGRAPQVVAVVKSSTSNGLGDLMVNLKDPTACVDASIHRRVLHEVESGKDISVGAVLILKEVAVFSPSRSSHYLNITPSNVVKIFSKDYTAVTAALEEDNLALTNINTCLISGTRGQPLNSQAQTRINPTQTQGILNNLKRNANSLEMSQHQTKRPPSGRPEVVTLKEQAMQAGDNNRHGSKEVAMDEDEACIVYELEDGNNVTNTVLEEGSRSQCNDVGPSKTDDVISTQANSQLVKQMEHSGGIALLPEWTDEQLDELFAMD